MTIIDATSLKVTLPFKAGELPRIDPERPTIAIILGTLRISCTVAAKAARKLAIHHGSAVLQGRLVAEGGQLILVDAGFTFIDPKPPATDPTTP